MIIFEILDYLGLLLIVACIAYAQRESSRLQRAQANAANRIESALSYMRDNVDDVRVSQRQISDQLAGLHTATHSALSELPKKRQRRAPKVSP